MLSGNNNTSHLMMLRRMNEVSFRKGLLGRRQWLIFCSILPFFFPLLSALPFSLLSSFLGFIVHHTPDGSSLNYSHIRLRPWLQNLRWFPIAKSSGFSVCHAGPSIPAPPLCFLSCYSGTCLAWWWDAHSHWLLLSALLFLQCFFPPLHPRGASLTIMWFSPFSDFQFHLLFISISLAWNQRQPRLQVVSSVFIFFLSTLCLFLEGRPRSLTFLSFHQASRGKWEPRMRLEPMTSGPNPGSNT